MDGALRPSARLNGVAYWVSWECIACMLLINTVVVTEMPMAAPMLRTRFISEVPSVLSLPDSVAKATRLSGAKTMPMPKPWMTVVDSRLK